MSPQWSKEEFEMIIYDFSVSKTWDILLNTELWIAIIDFESFMKVMKENGNSLLTTIRVKLTLHSLNENILRVKIRSIFMSETVNSPLISEIRKSFFDETLLIKTLDLKAKLEEIL